MSDWLETVKIRLIRESDLLEIEWGNEYLRYRKIYREVFTNFQHGLAIPYIAETEREGIIGQVFLNKKEANHVYSPDAPYFFLSSFRIKSGYRNMGLGTKMMRLCETTAQKEKISRICLNCEKTNIRGRRFYEQNGFSVFREDEGRWTFADNMGRIMTETSPAWSLKKDL